MYDPSFGYTVMAVTVIIIIIGLTLYFAPKLPMHIYLISSRRVGDVRVRLSNTISHSYQIIKSFNNRARIQVSHRFYRPISTQLLKLSARKYAVPPVITSTYENSSSRLSMSVIKDATTAAIIKGMARARSVSMFVADYLKKEGKAGEIKAPSQLYSSLEFDVEEKNTTVKETHTFIEVKVKLEKKVYEDLRWYIPLTAYSAGYKFFEESLNAWINDCVKEDLRHALASSQGSP